MNEEIIINAKRWLRARAGTIELKEHLLELLGEKFENPQEVLTLLIQEKIVENVDDRWIDLIKIFKGLSREEEEEE